MVGGLLSVASYAQEAVRSGDFFERTVSASRALRHTYDQQRVSLPWIEVYELRTESDEFDLNRQEYTARLTPTSPGVRKAQSALFQHYRGKLSLVTNNYLNDQLQAAYNHWTRLYLRQQELALYTRLRSIYQDKKQVYKKQVYQEDFDFAQLIDTQQKINELNIKVQELQISVRALKTQAGLAEEEVAFDDMISVDQIEDVLRNEGHQLPTDVDYVYRHELLNKEIAVEHAEKRKLFDFAQVKYGGGNVQEQLLNERISVGVGLKIPAYGKRNLKIQEMRIKQQELELEHQMFNRAAARETQNLLLQAHSKIEIYRAYEQASAEEKQSYQELKQFITNKEGQDALFLLKIDRSQIEAQLEKLKRLEEIYEDYLDYLALSQNMFARPFKNYLLNPPNTLEILREE